jgi:hypothetical protein
MGYPNRLLHDVITYWPPLAESKFGVPAVGAPTLLQGRWEERNERVRKPNGDEIVSTAVVFVDQDVFNGGHLYNGDASMDPDPHSAGALEIQAFVSVPDIRSVTKERRAYL